jgi:predicted SAM-dependent methyltransferase
MINIIRFLAKTVNEAISLIGIQIVRTQPKYGKLDIYAEKERPKTPRYINIGAGSFYHPYWHNVDTPNDFYKSIQREHIHIIHDLNSKQPLPFNNDTIKIAYISHVIEHLSNECVQFYFMEVNRCLQPGGFFRITCPDIDLEYDAYIRKDLSFYMWPTPWGSRCFSLEQRFLEHFATVLTFNHPETACHKYTDEEIRSVFCKLPKEEALKFFVDQIPLGPKHSSPENHINWFNVNKVRGMLKNAGFDSVYESRYGQSKCQIMRNTQLFDSTAPDLSLYVECQK